jgi:hypothetical protein
MVLQQSGGESTGFTPWSSWEKHGFNWCIFPNKVQPTDYVPMFRSLDPHESLVLKSTTLNPKPPFWMVQQSPLVTIFGTKKSQCSVIFDGFLSCHISRFDGIWSQNLMWTAMISSPSAAYKRLSFGPSGYSAAWGEHGARVLRSCSLGWMILRSILHYAYLMNIYICTYIHKVIGSSLFQCWSLITTEV